MKTIHKRGGLPPTIEYSLGDRSLKKVQQIHPWIRTIIESAPSDIQRILDQRWSGLTFEGPRAVRDLVIQFEPKSIAVTENESFLVMERPSSGASDSRSWDLLLVPPPCEASQVVEKLRRRGLEGNPVLQEFLVSFGGMSEEFGGNGFASPRTLFGFGQAEWEYLKTPDWNDAVWFFTSNVGDMICLRQDGMVACLLFETFEIVELGMDLNQFLKQYATYRQGQPSFETGAFLDFLGLLGSDDPSGWTSQ
jgi:hypothetical protein